MSPRLAPALGLAAACAMLTGVGVIAISMGSSPEQPTEIAGAVLAPPPASTPASSTSARQVKTNRASRSTPAPTPHSTSSYSNPPAAVVSSSIPPSQPASSPSAVRSSISSAPVVGGMTAAAPTLRTANAASIDDYAQAVFQAVNRARAAHHLPALIWSSKLQTSAHRHNQAMAASNTLSHQVKGEPALGPRETAAGVQWSYAAENIGWTTDRSVQGALDIEARMYGETAPNDAHKQNILSKSATALGVDVYLDSAHGRLWLTEDFSG